MHLRRQRATGHPYLPRIRSCPDQRASTAQGHSNSNISLNIMHKALLDLLDTIQLLLFLLRDSSPLGPTPHRHKSRHCKLLATHTKGHGRNLCTNKGPHSRPTHRQNLDKPRQPCLLLSHTAILRRYGDSNNQSRPRHRYYRDRSHRLLQT